MNSNEAFQILTQVCQNAKATLQEHQILQQALDVLKPKEEKKAE